jgi:hypothetical protein
MTKIFHEGFPTKVARCAGEDTDEHQNNAMWYHNFKDGTTTRFLTTPYGAETTSPYWYPNINGWSYLMAVVQHPYVESDQDKKCVFSWLLEVMLNIAFVSSLITFTRDFAGCKCLCSFCFVCSIAAQAVPISHVADLFSVFPVALL